jgi:hypothetical protein
VDGIRDGVVRVFTRRGRLVGFRGRGEKLAGIAEGGRGYQRQRGQYGGAAHPFARAKSESQTADDVLHRGIIAAHRGMATGPPPAGSFLSPAQCG